MRGPYCRILVEFFFRLYMDGAVGEVHIQAGENETNYILLSGPNRPARSISYLLYGKKHDRTFFEKECRV